MKDTVVVDIDGTVANIDHRAHFIKNKPKQWNKFFYACNKDEPNGWCIKLVFAMYKAGYKIHFVTGRKKALETMTRSWLDKIFTCSCVDEIQCKPQNHHPIEYELTLVRENRDFDKDFDLKRKWMFTYGKERILFVIEDRSQVVKMYREEGVTVLQCADGDY